MKFIGTLSLALIVFLSGFALAGPPQDSVAAPSALTSLEAGEAYEATDCWEASSDNFDSISEVNLDGAEYAQGCCKICKKGKACGNSCISRSKKCHKGRGCACDG